MTPHRIRALSVWAAAVAMLVAMLVPTEPTLDISTRLVGVCFGYLLLKQLLVFFHRLIERMVDAFK